MHEAELLHAAWTSVRMLRRRGMILDAHRLDSLSPGLHKVANIDGQGLHKAGHAMLHSKASQSLRDFELLKVQQHCLTGRPASAQTYNLSIVTSDQCLLEQPVAAMHGHAQPM